MSALLFGILCTPCFSLLATPQLDSIAWHHVEKRNLTRITEWIALGESYATGVGAGKFDEFRRCFRFDYAYPRLIQANDRIGNPATRNLTNAACSGSTASDILKEQFREKAGSDIEYGARPAFGKPQFATLSFGGNDVDLVGIVLNCVYEIIKYRECDDQIEHSWKLLQSEELAANIDSVLNTTIEKGRAATGDSFKVYVTGYPTFFNVDTDQCDRISWSVASRFWGEHRNMTKALRTTFNNMSSHLNGLLSTAVTSHAHQGARFIDWNADSPMMATHRFCEAGVEEPTTDRADTWFFEWTDDNNPTTTDQLTQALAEKLHPGILSLDDGDDATKSPILTAVGIDTRTYLDAAFDVAWENGTAEAEQWFINTVRVFHPKPALHQQIADLVVDEIVKDFGNGSRQSEKFFP